MQGDNQTGHAKKRWLMGLFLLALLLCGCTRREELLLMTEGSGAAAGAEAVEAEAAEAEAADAEAADAEAADAASADAAAEIQGSAGAGSLAKESGQEAEAPGQAGAQSGEAQTAGGKQESVSESAPVWVHVCGAVEKPGVYELQAGSRVYEAVQAAGGFRADAEQSYVNQAQILTDGVKLVIPTETEAQEARALGQNAGEGQQAAWSGAQLGVTGGAPSQVQETAESAAAGGKVNINTATEAELCGIPGVGAAKAKAIIAYRESKGKFTKPEDVMKVTGIKEGMYEKIKDSIRVD